MSKVLKRDVVKAHGAYGDALVRWGENNQTTLNALVRYHEVRDKWEAQEGKRYEPGGKVLGKVW